MVRLGLTKTPVANRGSLGRVILLFRGLLHGIK